MNNNYQIKIRKKLIEVSIPLEIINIASAREKSIRHFHPSTLHLWWARRPLASARAVIFCQIVDDPSSVPEEFKSEESQLIERERLFNLIQDIVQWENIDNQKVIERAREEIKRSWIRCCNDNKTHPDANSIFNPNKIPSFHDPFAGGGALPLEAQRLGLNSFGSDLNPIAALINKSMIEIPPIFCNMHPVNPNSFNKIGYETIKWKGAEGLSEDINYYSKWVKNKAYELLKDFYPKIKITNEIIIQRPDLKKYQGKELTIISWLWARTIKSTNPALSSINVPLISSFFLSSKKGKEFYLEPVFKNDDYKFIVKKGVPEDIEKVKSGTSKGAGNFECLISKALIPVKYIRQQGIEGKLDKCLKAIVLEGDQERVYLSPSKDQEILAKKAIPLWKPSEEVNYNPRDIRTQLYGLTTYGDLFSNRQLLALTTFSDLVDQVTKEIKKDAIRAGLKDDSEGLNHGGKNAFAYSEALKVYLAFIVSKCTDYWSSICTWNSAGQKMRNTFGRQAIPMSWDFAEANPFSKSTGNWTAMTNWVSKSVYKLPASQNGYASKADASNQTISINKIVATDPPYYDVIVFADLSDFFYVWLRKSLKDIYPDLFATITVPKSQELVAATYRHGSKKLAEDFFLEGMTNAMNNLARQAHKSFPISIYYAFKQSEIKSKEGFISTGWETFLSAVIDSGLSITGTWPIRTELANRIGSLGANSLASSIILSCRISINKSIILSRSDFRKKLRSELPKALIELEKANIAPVDVAQAAIGPGMAIYSQLKSVLNPDDSKMSVKEALMEINNALDEYLSKEENELDNDSRFALTFFESFGYSQRPFGDAEGLAKARNLSVEGIVEAGILKASSGSVNLIKRSELSDQWDPIADERLSAWEATQYLIKELEKNGEYAAAELLMKLKNINSSSDIAASSRSLAYRLYNHCEKTNQSEEARSYNSLVIVWPDLERIAADTKIKTTIQKNLI